MTCRVLVWYQRRSMIILKAIKILVPFPTIYLCKARFSSETSSKIYYRLNRLNKEADRTLQLSSIKPDTREICKIIKECCTWKNTLF